VCIYEFIGKRDGAVSSAIRDSRLSAINQMFGSVFWQQKFGFADARQRLVQTETLSHDWDTYGAEPPNDTSRRVAGELLRILERESLVPTRLTPSAEGGIALSFVEGSYRAIIEIYNTGEAAAGTYFEREEPTVWELEPTEDRLLDAIHQIRVHLAA